VASLTTAAVDASTKTPKGMTQPPLPHPLQLLFYFVCRFSQSRSGRQSPRSPGHRVTSKATQIHLAMPVPVALPRAGSRNSFN
jgi:hypothetical protein